MKNKLMFFALIVGALLPLQVAQAQTWSTAGSTCEPGSDSIGFYQYSNASFEFADWGATGQISTRCLVNNPLDSGAVKWKTLTMGYQDPDGRGGDYEVQASLQRVHKASGAHDVIVTIDSDSYTTTAATSKSITFTHTFDFVNYAYWVALRVNRNDSAFSPSVWFASLK